MANPFDQMKRMSVKYMRPTRFDTDLVVHDFNRLQEKDAPTVFGWILRELGTNLLDPRMNTKSLFGYIQHFETDGEDNYYFWFDGKILNKISFDDFKYILIETHDPSGEKTHNRY
ncbi:MAG: hypothetical protein ACTSW7_00600 [Candidatus Thorarchaeota archaeon]|nr:MAG: hypothetical protein DRP42_02865 [Mycoplasmatota bacterium]HEC72598.1 hypothetical protein [Thermoplasmatales archaeon]